MSLRLSLGSSGGCSAVSLLFLGMVKLGARISRNPEAAH